MVQWWTAAAPLHFSLSVDSCMIRAAAVTTLSSFMSLSFTKYQTEMFCFRILVNIFILRQRGVLLRDLWWGVINNICPNFCLFTLKQEAGEGGGGWVSFLKFTWTCVQTTLRGRATVTERESVPSRQILQANFWDMRTNRGHTHSRLHSFSLAYLPHTHICFCVILQLAPVYNNSWWLYW